MLALHDGEGWTARRIGEVRAGEPPEDILLSLHALD